MSKDYYAKLKTMCESGGRLLTKEEHKKAQDRVTEWRNKAGAIDSPTWYPLSEHKR